jgi:hypothetical protein
LSLKLNNKELVMDTMKPNFNLKIHSNTLVGMMTRMQSNLTLFPYFHLIEKNKGIRVFFGEETSLATQGTLGNKGLGMASSNHLII